MRRTPRPFGTQIRPTRVVSLLLGLAVLWMLYDRFRDPNTWRFLAPDAEPPVVAQLPGEQPAPAAEEIVIPGPNDTDQDEVLDNADKFNRVIDKKALTDRDMLAYWKLLEWSRTQPLAEFEKRARRDVLMTHLWNEPEKHKGKHPIHLRIDVVRSLHWDPETPQLLGVRRVFEAWGATPDSRGNPYCVVMIDPPPNLPLGENVSARIEFTGYFLKNMVYDTFDGKRRAAPLLLGRGRLVAVPKIAKASEKSDSFVTMFLVAAGLACGAVIAAVFVFRSGKTSRIVAPTDKALPDSLAFNLEDDRSASGSFPGSEHGSNEPNGSEYGGGRNSAASRVDFDSIVLGEYASPGSPVTETQPPR